MTLSKRAAEIGREPWYPSEQGETRSSTWNQTYSPGCTTRQHIFVSLQAAAFTADPNMGEDDGMYTYDAWLRRVASLTDAALEEMARWEEADA